MSRNEAKRRFTVEGRIPTRGYRSRGRRCGGAGAIQPRTSFPAAGLLTIQRADHVGLQEGPALCLKKLSADLEALQQLPHELTGGDLAVYASAQAAAAERKTRQKRRHTGRPEYCIYPATSGTR
jgi:hypothetical protein